MKRQPRLEDYAEFRAAKDTEKESINDDIVFEIELIKQIEINVDYILMLVQKYREAKGDGALNVAETFRGYLEGVTRVADEIDRRLA